MSRGRIEGEGPAGTIAPGRTMASPMIYGMRAFAVRLASVFRIFTIVKKHSASRRGAVETLRRLVRFRADVYGYPAVTKYARCGGRYFWLLAAPGWPGESFRRYVEGEISRKNPASDRGSWLQLCIFSVTRKCMLRCEHCFEWKNLASDDTLELADLKLMLRKLQDYGVSQVQIGGGEPLCRLEDALELVRGAKPGTDFWLLTSGFGLTMQIADQLKRAGFTGVDVSLDHWDEVAHNTLRNNSHAFANAVEALQSCRAAGLLTCVTVCATREFVSDENLNRYLELAKQLGTGFVQILEARSVGHFSGLDVRLSATQKKLLDAFYIEVNSSKRWRDYPIVNYPGYTQRHMGCFGAGNRYLYVDSIGEVHACPFCQGSVGNLVTEDLPDLINMLQSTGCADYPHIAITEEAAL